MGFDLIGRRRFRGKAICYQCGTFCWWPLWSFVCREAADILDEADQENGCYNQGHYITAGKAAALAERLVVLLRRRVVSAESARHLRRARRERRKNCPSCHGRRVVAIRTDSEVLRMRCSHCDGTGRRRAFPMFRTAWVREFAAFCAESGGFRIW